MELIDKDGNVVKTPDGKDEVRSVMDMQKYYGADGRLLSIYLPPLSLFAGLTYPYNTLYTYLDESVLLANIIGVTEAEFVAFNMPWIFDINPLYISYYGGVPHV
jgi:hypothetical protein